MRGDGFLARRWGLVGHAGRQRLLLGPARGDVERARAGHAERGCCESSREHGGVYGEREVE